MSTDIQQPKQYTFLIIGEECVDLYRYGKCKRLSPEAPVAIVLEEKSETRPGMAANVSKNIESLGHKTILISNGKEIIKERIVDHQHGQQLLRIDKNDHCEPLKLSWIKDVLDDINKCDATIISDYDKGFLTPKIIAKILPLLPKPIFVDSKKNDLSPYEDCILKINQFEHLKVVQYPKEYELIVTCGEEGAKYKNKRYPVKKIEIKDICGAGDSFISAFAISYLDSNNFSKAIRFANACASVSVTVPGVYSPTLEEVMNDIRH